MTDVPELDQRAYIEDRRVTVRHHLDVARWHLQMASEWYLADKCPENRTYLVKAIACVEVFEAKQEALDVEFA
jgi:hypothetical protein